MKRAPPPLVAGLAAGLFVAFAGMLLWSPAAVGVFNDDGVYVLLGKALAEGHGLRYAGVVGAPPAAKFPPLYPLLLAGVWKLWPSFPANVPAFKALNLVLAGSGAGLLAAYLVTVFRVRGRTAVALAAAVSLTVDTWRYAVIPLSEPLFVLALVAALAAAARVERGGEGGMGAGALLLALVATAAAFYARTIGIVLIPAVALGWLLAGRRRAAALVVAAGVAAVSPWMLWTRVAAARIPAPLADILGPYGNWLAAEVGESGAGYTGVLARRALDLVGRVLAALLPGLPNVVQWALAPVIVAAAIAGGVWAWKRARSARTTVLAVVGLLLVLWLWPFAARRLVAPVVPWLALGVGAGFMVGARHRRPRMALTSGTAALAWAGWFVSANVLALSARRHDLVLLERSIVLSRAAEAVRAATPPDAVVGAPELWAGLHLYTGRTVAPSARFRPWSKGPVWGTPEEQLKLWRAAGIDYLVLEFGGRVHGDALLALQRACGAESVRSVARFPGGELVRLVWTEECPV
ncbi:MAG: hypothetical protein HY704_08510 [Gemmatimonadetes bacterium]|nr:hypothetical protein [Gemmatimonadota bacterium]